METDYSSILDRLRVLEMKLENGVAAAPQNNTGISEDMLQELYSRLNTSSASFAATSEDGNNDDHSKKLVAELKRDMPEADFQELKDIVEQWDIILESYQRITRGFLQSAKLVINEDKNGLYLTYIRNEENKKAIAYFSDKERLAVLCEKIAELTGRKVNITLRVVNDDARTIKDTEDNNLAKINFNIINI
jgi:hypothetical protein